MPVTRSLQGNCLTTSRVRIEYTMTAGSDVASCVYEREGHGALVMRRADQGWNATGARALMRASRQGRAGTQRTDGEAFESSFSTGAHWRLLARAPTLRAHLLGIEGQSQQRAGIRKGIVRGGGAGGRGRQHFGVRD